MRCSLAQRHRNGRPLFLITECGDWYAGSVLESDVHLSAGGVTEANKRLLSHSGLDLQSPVGPFRAFKTLRQFVREAWVISGV